jgi:hypothetical protein
VWASASQGVAAYQPAHGGAVEPSVSRPDWRGLLDLLEEQTGTSFDDIWRTWIARPADAALLDARAAARSAYARTLALAGAWELPATLREALRSWQFDTAEQLMTDARTVIAQRDAVESAARSAGLAVPDTVRGLFESGDLTAASTEARAELETIADLRQARAARIARPDPIERLGLVDTGPDADLSAAEVAFAGGELDVASASAEAARSVWAGAWDLGRRRAIVAIAALLASLGVGWIVVSGLWVRPRSMRPERRRPARAGGDGGVSAHLGR